ESPVVASVPLQLGESMSGMAEREVLHPFRATMGTELMITARSRDFDTVLEVGRVEAGRFVELIRDDDGAGGSDSRVYFDPPTDGEYAARVRPYSAVDGG